MMYFALISVQTSTSESQLEHSKVLFIIRNGSEMQGVMVGNEALLLKIYMGIFSPS